VQYRFATQRQAYADLSSGRVFHSRPGYPAFPIRLASELYQLCRSQRQAAGLTSPCTVYDPCCGGAYLLCTLAFLHWDTLSALLASDVDEQAVVLAQRNLSLLTLGGMDQRMQEIAALLEQHGKSSHQAALESARALRDQLSAHVAEHSLQTRIFQADAANAQAIRRGIGQTHIDFVLTDVPYGWHTEWRTAVAPSTAVTPLWAMLDALRGLLDQDSLIAVASDKGQKIAHTAYQRVERLSAGRRQVVVLRPTQP